MPKQNTKKLKKSKVCDKPKIEDSDIDQVINQLTTQLDQSLLNDNEQTNQIQENLESIIDNLIQQQIVDNVQVTETNAPPTTVFQNPTPNVPLSNVRSSPTSYGGLQTFIKQLDTKKLGDFIKKDNNIQTVSKQVGTSYTSLNLIGIAIGVAIIFLFFIIRYFCCCK